MFPKLKLTRNLNFMITDELFFWGFLDVYFFGVQESDKKRQYLEIILSYQVIEEVFLNARHVEICKHGF